MTQYGRHRDDWGRWFRQQQPHMGLALRARRRRPPSGIRSTPPPTRARYLSPTRGFTSVSRTAPRFNDPRRGQSRDLREQRATPYRDDLFGEHFIQCFVHQQAPVHNLVHAMIGVEERRARPFAGAACRARPSGSSSRSSDAWFRPTMLKTGPDGAIWVADMARAVIEHPEWIPDDWEAKLGTSAAGADRGPDLPAFVRSTRHHGQSPGWTVSTLAALVAAMNSPNGWQPRHGGSGSCSTRTIRRRSRRCGNWRPTRAIPKSKSRPCGRSKAARRIGLKRA